MQAAIAEQVANSSLEPAAASTAKPAETTAERRGNAGELAAEQAASSSLEPAAEQAVSSSLEPAAEQAERRGNAGEPAAVAV